MGSKEPPPATLLCEAAVDRGNDWDKCSLAARFLNLASLKGKPPSTLLGIALPTCATNWGLYHNAASVVLAERAQVSLNGEVIVAWDWPAWAYSWVRQNTSLLEGKTEFLVPRNLMKIGGFSMNLLKVTEPRSFQVPGLPPPHSFPLFGLCSYSKGSADLVSSLPQRNLIQKATENLVPAEV